MSPPMCHPTITAMPRALVVGGDGRLARTLITALERDGYSVIATTRRRGGRLVVDLAEVARTGSADLPDCDVAFVCAAMSSYAECRANEARARAVNIDGPTALARALRGRG